MQLDSPWVVVEQPCGRRPRSHSNMDNVVNLPPPSGPEPEFWKGFLLGAMTGMVVAAYTYVMTDFSFAKPIRRFAPARSLSQKPAA